MWRSQEDTVVSVRAREARRFTIDILLGFRDRILMLYVYRKNERENLTEEQKKSIRQVAKEYKHE